jgi:5-methylcytosine-specific restriction endonuclease McrA
MRHYINEYSSNFEEHTRVRAFIRKEYARQQRIAQRYPKEARLVEKHNQRALFSGGEGSLTIGQWVITLEHYNWLCTYCGGPYEELEHRIPIDRGGGTTAKNCVPSCQSCNRRKGVLHPEEIIARETSLSPTAHRRIEAEMETLHGTWQRSREMYQDAPMPEQE